MKLKKRITLSIKNSLRFLPDRAYTTLYFILKLHYFPNIDEPRTYNEKLQWYKLYYRNPALTGLADKYAVRSFVESRIGAKYLVPLLGVYDDAEQIDLRELPEKFVLKCTHDSQSTVICRDRAQFDFGRAKKMLRIALRRNWFWQGREWAYLDIQPKIVAEMFLEEPGRETPTDFKFYCFDGKVSIIQTDADRFSNHDMQYFSPSWEPCGDIEFEVSTRTPTPKPDNLAELIELSEKLSHGFPHVRVDWFNISGRPYFGEMTFYTGGGFDPFYARETQPDGLDCMLGDRFQLPSACGDL